MWGQREVTRKMPTILFLPFLSELTFKNKNKQKKIKTKTKKTKMKTTKSLNADAILFSFLKLLRQNLRLNCQGL